MKDTYSRQEILELFLEAQKASEKLEKRLRPQYVLGWVMGGFGIVDEYRAAAESVTK